MILLVLNTKRNRNMVKDCQHVSCPPSLQETSEHSRDLLPLPLLPFEEWITGPDIA